MRLNTQNWKTKKGEQNAVKYIGGTIFLNIITIILTIMLYEGTHGIRHLIYIILGIQIISINKKEKITFNKLYYRFTEGGITRILLLGHVKIPVGELIKTWDEEGKKLFYKTNKTPKEKERLQELVKKDLYTEYQYKKHEKMDLLLIEGIMRPRVLDTAEIVLKTILTLTPLTKVIKINRDMIRSLLQEEIRDNKLAISLVGQEELIRDVQGVIGTYQELNTIKQKRTKLKSKDITQIEYLKTDKLLEQAQEQLAQIGEKQLQEYENYKRIKKQYDTTT